MEGEKLLSIRYLIISKTLEKKTMCVMEAKRLAAVTLSSLHEQRSDVYFDKIWEELLVKDGQYFHAGE